MPMVNCGRTGLLIGDDVRASPSRAMAMPITRHPPWLAEQGRDDRM